MKRTQPPAGASTAHLQVTIWGSTVTLLATTATQISEIAGLRVGDVDLRAG